MAVALMLCATPTLADRAPAYDEAAVRLAVIDAVRARLGGDADITLDKVKIVLDSTVPVVAMPEPGARLGRVVRFMLVPAAPAKAGEALVAAGYALADVRAAVRHLEVARPVTHGTELGAQDLSEVVGDIGPLPMERMPVLADVVGSRASRDLRQGEIVTPAILRSQPLVRSGDVVRTRIAVGTVEVFGRAVAQQSGQRNDRIKLVNPDSRKSLTGLITAAGEVVIVHER
jgi:flagellar basal body P-ring formation protein FlgA